jgi:hypothetical protein
MDSQTILEPQANTTVRANPTVEANVQNSEIAAADSNYATISNITSQLRDLLTTVMTAIQAERIKQTAPFQTEVAKLTEPKRCNFYKKMRNLPLV